MSLTLLRNPLACTFVIGFAASCGGDGSKLASGAGRDASNAPDAKSLPDAKGLPDAPTGPNAKITYVANPNEYDVAGSRVVFYFADGSVSKIATLDDQGTAEGYVNDGGSVTFIEHKLAIGTTPETVEIRTILGMAEGEEIQIGYRFPAVTDFPITINGPAYPDAASYVVTTYCNRGSSGSPVSATPTGLLSMAHGCTQADLLLEARNSDGQRIATLFGKNVEVAPNATIELQGEYMVPRQRPYSLTNIPAEVMGVTVLAFPHPIASSYATGLVPTQGSLTHTAVFPDTDLVEALSSYTFNFAYGVNSYYRTQDTFVGDAALDVGPQIMPIASATSLASDRRTISWTETTGAASTAITAGFQYVGTSREFRGSWHTLAPHGATTIVLPALPAELASFGPQADDYASPPSIEIEYVEGGTYTDFRQKSLAGGSGFYSSSTLTRSSSYYPPEA